MCASMHACRGLMAHIGFLLSHNTHTHKQKNTKLCQTPPAPSQEDPITVCVSIKMVPLYAPWLLIAISSPQWVPTQAALVRLCNWPLEEQHNGVNCIQARDKTNVPLLNARFPTLLLGTHTLACYVLNLLSHGKIVAHPEWLCVCRRQQMYGHSTEQQARKLLLISHAASSVKYYLFM